MPAHLAFNDIARLSTSQLVSVTGTATATAVTGEPITSAVTRPLRRSAAWTVAGGASGGTVRIRLESATISRTLRVVAALGLELPTGATAINALIRSGTTTAATGTPLAAADFARPYDTDRTPWHVVWTFDGTAGDGVELVVTLAAGASGTLRVGRVWGSESLLLRVAPGWSESIEDTSIVQYGPQSRSPSVYQGDVYRRLQLSLTARDEAYTFGTAGASDLSLADLDAAAAYLGAGRDVIALPTDTTAHQRQRLPRYGTIERPLSRRHVARDLYAADLEVVETR